MNRRAITLTLLTALTGWAAAPSPVHWTLEAVPTKPVKAGAHFAPKLVAAIDEGWHLYALDEPDGTANPTEITLSDDSSLTMGAIKAPKPITVLDPNFGKPTSFYTTKADFTLPLQLQANSVTGTAKLAVKVRYQTCSATTCLAPKTVTVEAPFTIK